MPMEKKLTWGSTYFEQFIIGNDSVDTPYNTDLNMILHVVTPKFFTK